MKNQLLQAFAAINFADGIGRNICFYINANRAEQNGENNLKNIRALFKGTEHKLVEVPWLEHKEFVQLIAGFDLGMQVSFTESFNLVTADFVHQGVPILVGDDISWMPEKSRVSPTAYGEIVRKLSQIYNCPKNYTTSNSKSLERYNKHSKLQWKEFLGLKEEKKGFFNLFNS